MTYLVCAAGGCHRSIHDDQPWFRVTSTGHTYLYCSVECVLAGPK